MLVLLLDLILCDRCNFLRANTSDCETLTDTIFPIISSSHAVK